MASSSFVAKRIAKEFTKNLIGNFTEPESLPVYRKMLTFRCHNLGMKELDIVLGRWAVENVPKFTVEDCQQFERQILDHETPDLFKLILKIDIQEELRLFQTDRYIQEIRAHTLKGLI